MFAKTVEELLVYQKALAGAHAISALITGPAFTRDRDLASQMGRASVRIVSNIAEGFEQKTDRHFASYLYNARGSTRELRAQLRIAVHRRHLSDDSAAGFEEKFAEIARMLTGLITHLEKENRQDRRTSRIRAMRTKAPE